MALLRMSYIAIVSIGFLAVAMQQTEELPAFSLRSPPASVSAPFGRIGGVHERSDQSLVVLDPDEVVLTLLSPDLRTATSIGRVGRGPGEYQLPDHLLALGRDSTGVWDLSGSIVHVVDGSGRIAGTIVGRWDRACAGATGIRLQAIRGFDSHGHRYSQAEPIATGADGVGRPADSAAVERWIPCQRDTVALIPILGGSGRRVIGGQIIIGGSLPLPFASETQWAANAEGRVAVAHLEPFHLEFVDENGQRTKGRQIAYKPIVVTEQMKDEWRVTMRKPRMATVFGRDGSTAKIPAAPPFEEPSSWPRYLPPFPKNAIQLSADGSVWLRISTTPDDLPLYYVFDTSGKPVRRVQLVRGSRIVGFGRTSIYIARTTSDEQEVLERYDYASLTRVP